jgi:type IV pilus assembly protein PilY1
LAHISAYVENPQTDNTVQYVYGGDLEGNVWRFDLNDVSTANCKLKRLAALVDAQTTPVKQPVTTAPELSKIYVSGSEKRFVYVGTGRYLGDTDIPGATGANVHATQTQTMYGLVDDLSNPTGSTPVISPLRSNLGQQTFGTPVNGKRVASKTALNLSSKKGWYIDLPVTGERSVTNPILAVGALVFTTNIPSSDVCTPGGSSWLNILDYQTGGQVVGLNYASESLGNVLASRPILIQLGDGTIKVLVRTSGGGSGGSGSGPDTRSLDGPPSGALSNTRRVAWKEVVSE